MVQEYFNSNTVTRDMFGIMVGEKIGYGIGREVFEVRGDSTKVIKFETTAGSFQNIIEWETWQDVCATPQAKWLAPCVRISANGAILVMERTAPIPPQFKLPTHVPAFLSDFKRENYGLLKGRLVCHDYGTNLACRRGSGKAMRALGKRLSCSQK
jgi:hypothetical protein